MKDDHWQAWFEEAWEFREEKIYPAQFGRNPQRIYTLNGEIFTNIFRQQSCDPRWLTHGVIEFEPTEKRPSWVYVSSGLSNPWDAKYPDPNAESGLGCEFIFQAPMQAPWAIVLLHKMVAFQILLVAGKFPGRGPLGIWDRIPLRSPIDGEYSQLTWLVVTPTTEFSGDHRLSCGHFQFFQFVGITENEAAYGREHGSEDLFRLLVERNAAPVTSPNRESILDEKSPG